MKKLLCLILAALAILSLSACGADDSTPPETTEHVHDYAITENIPNCTEGGEIIGTCTCGDRYTEAIDPKEHTYSDWVVTQEPTTEAAGQKQQVCTVCEHEVVEDMPVNKMTDGEWDGIEALQGMFYFWRMNENGKKERSEYIGAYGSLYDWQKIKSVAWVNFTYILFEEFIAADYYLDDEPTKLQRVVTAIFRDHKGKVLMLGNTISRTCPYFLEWCPNVIKQQPGTIEVYNMHDEAGEGIEVKIACEYTGHVKGSGSMFFGQASKAIMAGEWDVVNSPKLPKDKMDYEKMIEHHKEKDALLTIAVMEVPWEEAPRFGIMNTDDTGRIVEFEEKPEEPKSNLASMGIYVFTWKRLKKYLMDNAKHHKAQNQSLLLPILNYEL